MNIEKALEHLEWKFKNTWKPTKKDIEAYNAIINYKKIQESKSLYENESLCKLFLEAFMSRMNTNTYTSQSALKSIHVLLKSSVYELCLKLKEQMPIYAFRNIGGVILEEDALNITKHQEKKDYLLNNKSQELHDALCIEFKEEDVIKWVEKQVNKIITEEKI